MLFHYVPRSRLLAAEQECARLRAELEASQKLAARYLDLLTRRDACAHCGWLLGVPDDVPTCGCALTEQDRADWARVAKVIEETVRRAHAVG